LAAEPVTIVTLGDSITKGVRTGVKAEETFSAMLETMLKKEGFDVSVVNVGIGGERTDQALARLDREVIARKPAVVTIMYGTNDSYVDKGAKTSRLTADEYTKNLKELVTRLRAANVMPVLMTEPCHGDKATANGIGEHPNVRLATFVQRCRDVAKESTVPLVDNYQVWSDHNSKGTDVGSWTTDQCHPNPQGHRLIAQTMLPVLVKVLKTPAKASK
jgi:acyl-CoA thioesterase-1